MTDPTKRTRAKIVQLSKRPTLDFYELAQLIAQLHEQPSSIRDLPEATGMSRRRLYYLLRIGHFIEANGITKCEAEKVGWTKLQMVAEHFAKANDPTPEELGRWLALASVTNVPSLPMALQEDAGSASSTEKRAVVFYLNPDQQGELSDALLAFGAEMANRGLFRKEAALMQIIRAVS